MLHVRSKNDHSERPNHLRARPVSLWSARSARRGNETLFVEIDVLDGSGAKPHAPQQAKVPSVQAPVTSRGFCYGVRHDSEADGLEPRRSLLSCEREFVLRGEFP